MKARRTQAMPRRPDPSHSRQEIAARLRERRGEIEEVLLTRTYAIADPREASDPEYAQGLRAAVAAALEYGLGAVERGSERAPPLPVLLLAQARLAARNAIPLDTVLRRYFAGYTVLSDFIVGEASRLDLGEAEMKRLLRDQAALFDGLIAAVTEEHAREGETTRVASSEQRRIERIERLLAGELLDSSELAYDFEGWHLGAVASGPGAAQALRELAGTQDCHLLLVRPEKEMAWGWLGARQKLDPRELHSRPAAGTAQSAIGLGEPGNGLAGWRLSHCQALAALRAAQHAGQRSARYLDVALLASVLQDDLLIASLRQIYLAPLERTRDGGEVLRHTLGAYFSHERNSVSTAAALGVTRQTVNNRLRTIEERIGQPIRRCAGELEIALRLSGP